MSSARLCSMFSRMPAMVESDFLRSRRNFAAYAAASGVPVRAEISPAARLSIADLGRGRPSDIAYSGEGVRPSGRRRYTCTSRGLRTTSSHDDGTD